MPVEDGLIADSGRDTEARAEFDGAGRGLHLSLFLFDVIVWIASSQVAVRPGARKGARRGSWWRGRSPDSLAAPEPANGTRRLKVGSLEEVGR